MGPQPSTSHSMGNLLSMPRHTAGYQERLVDWNVDRIPQPGARVSQVQTSKSQYFNSYEFPNNAHQSHSVASQSGILSQAKPIARSQTATSSSCLAMYPIDEAPIDTEDCNTRSANHWTNNRRPIPIIQEPNQMFLTIPSHMERYPPYPARNRKARQLDDSGGQGYGYYSDDKTVLDFPELNHSRDSLRSVGCGESPAGEMFSFDCSQSSIPYIDQLDEGCQASSRSQENIHSGRFLDVDGDWERRRACNLRDSNNVHINLIATPPTRGTTSRPIAPRPSSALQEHRRVLDDDERTIRTNSLDRSPKKMTLLSTNPSLGEIDVSAKSKNLIVTHCCCHGRLTHCREHDDQRVDDSSKNIRQNEIADKPDESNDGSESLDSKNDYSETKDWPTGASINATMPELNLDLSGLNSDVSSDDSNTQEKCWKSPEQVRLGYGRVAALTKHFSKLGEAGLIKFKSIKLSSSRQFVSEPDIASPRSPEVTGNRRRSEKEFKSENDLTRADKSVATTPEREWSMILLDIQARNEMEMENFYEQTNDRDRKGGSDPASNENSAEADNEPGELKKSSSKLSLAEQQGIIEQLKEFANLDNADAPLFIPDEDDPISNGAEDDSKGSSLAKETMTESVDSLPDNCRSNATEMPRYRTVIGRMRMEHFRKHSLPTILSSSLDISPGFETSCKKVNKLEKYWSLKDLMSSDDTRSESSPYDRDGSPKYFIFPASSRVSSTPELSNDNIDIFHVQSLNSSCTSGGNVTIRSTISIGEQDEKSAKSNIESETERSASEKCERGSSPIVFRDTTCPAVPNNGDEAGRRKFPGSFIRTRKLSKSHDGLYRKTGSTKFAESKNKIGVCRSLEKIPMSVYDKGLASIKPLHRCKTGTSSPDVVSIGDRGCKHILDCHSASDAGLNKPMRKKSLIIRKRSKSDMDVSERKPTPRFERGDWIFRDFPPLEIGLDSRKLMQIMI